MAHAAYVRTGPGSADPPRRRARRGPGPLVRGRVRAPHDTSPGPIALAPRGHGGRAEVAFLVADAWQGHGIATLMLAHLAAAAQEHGIETFTAEVLPHNHRMIEVFRDSGFPVELHSSSEVLEIELPTSLSAGALERFERREQTAAVAAVQSFLCPRAVAVVGASRRRRTVGAEILRNLLVHGYTGTVYPVNSRARTVQGHRAYASVRELPERVDLAVVAVPAAQVVDVARDCGAAGVRALLVVSAGFAEVGAEGAARQDELLEVCRETGMRVVGPNCLGVLNTAPDVRLDATFAAGAPLRAASASSPRAAGWGSRSSKPPGASASASPRSRRWATRPTSPATTCSSTGSRTRTPTWCCCTWSPSATRAGSPASRAA